MNYQFHHVGIPTTEVRPGERYSAPFKMYTSGGEAPTRIQYHRFEEGCPLHPLLQTKPHVAFKVDSIDEAIRGKNVILEPYFPFEGFKVAAIEENGWPIEFIETSLSEEEIWGGSAYKNSVIYPESE
ncbi:helicase [Legionella genomosp. 1]|uniref:helicase n=1 Tax=Legionella genomosp. 1 TaxID=1093625 RepID=UPI001054845E|nr:helicase [Legionella genomosp. 1]